MLALGAFFLFAAGMKLFLVQRICNLSDLSWSHVLSQAFSRPEPTQTYSGVEVLAATGVEGALLYAGCTIIFIVYFFAVRGARKKNLLLLQYIDKERETQQKEAFIVP